MKPNINCDLGEGSGNDEQLMPYLDSCSIACGGHFGDKDSMLIAIKCAIKNGVKVGAHPSFPDKINFGRKIIDIPREKLQATVFQQITDFKKQCNELNIEMHHVKLHGALYNLAANNPEIAGLMLNTIAAVQAEVLIYVPYNSVIALMAEDYFPIAYEAFIDRRYQTDLSLVARSNELAVITNVDQAWQQMSNIINDGKVKTVKGEYIAIKADTFCLHGDEKNALNLLKYIRRCL